MELAYIQVCTSFGKSASGNPVCTASEYVHAYLIPADVENPLGGFNGEMFGAGFGGVLLLFVTGFGVGLIISQIRKLRIK